MYFRRPAGSQGSKIGGFHVTRVHKGGEQWAIKLLALDACGQAAVGEPGFASQRVFKKKVKSYANKYSTRSLCDIR